MLDPSNAVLSLTDVVDSQYWYYRQNEQEQPVWWTWIYHQLVENVQSQHSSYP